VPGLSGLRRWWFAVLLAVGGVVHAEPPALAQAGVYREGEVELADYWVSEKYDGVRAYWDGRQLWTRGGEPIRAPAWFTAGWPSDQPLDGELWAGHGAFEQASGAARRQEPDDMQWQLLRYLVFDLPQHPGPFTERLKALNALIPSIGHPWVQAVEQVRVADAAALQARLAAVVAAGGEGLMLHRGEAPYRAARTGDLLKLKTHDDAEARVVAHLPGRGRNEGRLGALLVETPAGLRFRIGTGFTDAQRAAPPPIGAWVTYAYNGHTANGVPRFARFLRERPDWTPPLPPPP
jgi:DNA ligase-1